MYKCAASLRLLFAGCCLFTLRRQLGLCSTTQKGERLPCIVKAIPASSLVMVLWLLSLGAALNATPLTWYVDATLINGGVVTGSFEYDATTVSFSNIDLKTTQDGLIPPKEFSESICSPITCGFAVNVFDSTGYGLSVVPMAPFFAFPAAGGTVPIGGLLYPDSAPLSDPLDHYAGSATTIPEPSSAAMLTGALGLIGGIQWRRRRGTKKPMILRKSKSSHGCCSDSESASAPGIGGATSD